VIFTDLYGPLISLQVSINYRLGVFGWLGGEKAVDDGVVPNVGLKDQQVAFEWVRDYIHAFGGDSRRYAHTLIPSCGVNRRTESQSWATVRPSCTIS
jgi:hypothetical protein